MGMRFQSICFALENTTQTDSVNGPSNPKKSFIPPKNSSNTVLVQGPSTIKPSVVKCISVDSPYETPVESIGELLLDQPEHPMGMPQMMGGAVTAWAELLLNPPGAVIDDDMVGEIFTQCSKH